MDFINIILGTVSLGSLSYSVKQHFNANTADKKLKELIKTKNFTPKELIDGIREKEAYLVNRFKDYGRNEIAGKVFVDGVIKTDFPIKSHLTQDQLIHKIQYKKDIYSNDRTKKSRHKINFKHIPKDSIQEKSPTFYLEGYKEKENCLIVNNGPDEADFHLALDLIESKDELRKLDWMEKILVAIFMLFDLASRVKGGFGFRGIKIGVNDTEMGIKLDSFMTVFGEVIYNFEKKTLKIENPEYFLKNKRDLLESLKDYISSCKWHRAFWGILGGICLGILGYRLYEVYEKSRNVNPNPAAIADH